MSEIDELLDNLALLAGAEDTTLDYAGLGVEIVEAKTAIAALFDVQATRIAALEAALGGLLEEVIDATEKPMRPVSLAQAIERALDVLEANE
jgi:hypothetical protein